MSFLATIVFVQTTFFSFPFLIAADTCKQPLRRCGLSDLLIYVGKCTLPLLLCNILTALHVLSLAAQIYLKSVPP